MLAGLTWPLEQTTKIVRVDWNDQIDQAWYPWNNCNEWINRINRINRINQINWDGHNNLDSYG
jgi:hypothetical protein